MNKIHYSVILSIITVLILFSVFYSVVIHKKSSKLNMKNQDINDQKFESSDVFDFTSESSSLEDVSKEVSTVNQEIQPIIDTSIKIVLIWTKHDPFKTSLYGEAFSNRSCKVKNCYITRNKNYLSHVSVFDVILFYVPDIVDKKTKLPFARSTKQKYVFASNESSQYYPVCDNRFNNYFNMTWTYKLTSDVFWGNLIVRNHEGEVIGPKKEINWLHLDEMKPINETMKQLLKSKNKLAAWLVSNCHMPIGGDDFIQEVQIELESLKSDNMTIDIYGNCGMSCEENCLNMLEKNYYFYFSFENTFDDDYVTEQLLFPLQHYMVPVVYGGADYERFMPDGIYLKAKELGPANLVKQMVEIATNDIKYHNYFKWMNHYSYHKLEDSPETDFYCKFCESINNETFIEKSTEIRNFREWWNPKLQEEDCPLNQD